MMLLKFPCGHLNKFEPAPTFELEGFYICQEKKCQQKYTGREIVNSQEYQA